MVEVAAATEAAEAARTAALSTPDVAEVPDGVAATGVAAAIERAAEAAEEVGITALGS